MSAFSSLSLSFLTDKTVSSTSLGGCEDRTVSAYLGTRFLLNIVMVAIIWDHSAGK